jgi:hypothetical protein
MLKDRQVASDPSADLLQNRYPASSAILGYKIESTWGAAPHCRISLVTLINLKIHMAKAEKESVFYWLECSMMALPLIMGINIIIITIIPELWTTK